MLNNGSAWLSDAQDEYVVTFSVQGRNLPSECKVGQRYTWDTDDYTVTTITKAHYRGVEGELPFQYWDKSDVVFVDLMATAESVQRLITATRPLPCIWGRRLS